jgi:hypothetical protein
MFFDTVLPALVLTACALMLLRMVLPGAARQRLDATGRAFWRLLRHGPAAWLARRRQAQARHQARQAIERARHRLRHGAPRPRRGSAPEATDPAGAQVHDLAQHRRRRHTRDAAPDAAPAPQDKPTPGPDDEPPPPPRPTLH